MNFTPFRIAAIYFFFALAWIVLTDYLSFSFVDNARLLSYLHLVKGIFYITFTAVMLYMMVRSYKTFLNGEREKQEDMVKSFNRALRSAGMATWEYFVHANKFVTSPNYNELFGLDKDIDITRDEILNKIYNDDVERFKNAIGKILSGQTEIDEEYRVQKRDGSVHWLWTKGLVYGSNTPAEKISGVTLDITAKKILEKKLEFEKEKFQKLFDRIPVLIHINNSSLNVDTVNREFVRELGWDEKDLKENDLLELCFPDPEYRKEVIKKSTTNDEGWQEFKVTAKHGETRDQLWTNINLADDTRVRIGYDITDLKSVEKQLIEERQRFEVASNLISDVVWEWNPSNEKVWWGDGMENVLGHRESAYSRDNQFWENHLHKSDRAWVEESMNEAINSDKTYWREDYRFIAADGSVREIEDKAKIFRDRMGNVTRIVGVMIDVTELNKHRERYKRAEEIAHLGHWKRDLVTDKAIWSDGFYKITQLDKKVESSSFQYIMGMVHPEDRDTYLKAFEDARKSGKLAVNYRMIKQKSGDIGYYHELGEVEYDADGNAVSMSGTVQDITEMAKYQIQLRESQKLLRKTFESFDEAVIILEPKTQTIIDCNKGVEKIFGYNRKELIGSTTRLLHVDEHHFQDFDRISKKGLKRNELFQIEFEMKKKNGETFYSDLTVTFVLDDDNNEIIRVVSVIRDITDKKIAREKLKASEEQYRLLFEQSPISMWIYDKETLNFIDANNPAITNYGYSREELRNMKVYHLHPKEEREIIKKEISDSLKLPQTGFDAWRQITKNGKELMVEISGSDILYKGKICRLIIGNDITDRRIAEKKLRASEEQYRLLFEQNPIPMWIYDPDTFMFTEVNQAANEKYGYSREEFLKMSIFDIRPENDIEKIKRNIEMSRGLSNSSTQEWTHISKGGKPMKVEVSGSDIFYKSKQQRLVIANDITEQRKAEKRAISAIIEGEERERQRIAKELHDGLGQYLSAANMNLETVYEDIPEMDNTLDSSFKNGLELLGQAILETRTISQNLLPKAIQDYGLGLAVESLVNQLKSTNKGIQFYFYQNLQQAEIPNKIQINLYRIAQEALNNAIRHGNPKNIDIQLVYSEGEILMSIEDNGTGFDMNAISGEGIGLRSMKTRVGAMAANIDIVSTRQRGTIISVVIPL